MTFLRNNKTFLALLIPFLIIPWISWDGYHLLLFNFSHNRLEFLFIGVETGTYALIGITILLGLGIALITAMTLSRFYCGTLCPNTFFAHFLSVFKGKKKSFVSKLMGFSLLSALASALLFSLISYGIDTTELLISIQTLSFAGWLVILLSVLMIAEVYIVQGWYCAYLCPYGATCAILPIEDRLTYVYEDPEHHCTECAGCVKICPIPDLDIRHGFDIRCIQCGLCEAACEKIFAKNPDITTLISRESRSPLTAGGRGKKSLIAIIAIIIFVLGSVVFLSNPNNLDSCRLENSFLHQSHI